MDCTDVDNDWYGDYKPHHDTINQLIINNVYKTQLIGLWYSTILPFVNHKPISCAWLAGEFPMNFPSGGVGGLGYIAGLLREPFLSLKDTARSPNGWEL